MWKIRVLQAVVTAGIVLAFQGLFIYNGVLVPKNAAPEQLELKTSSDEPSIEEVCYKDPNDPTRVGRPFLLPPEYKKLVDDYLNSKPLSRSKREKIRPQLVTAFSANHFHEHSEIVPSAFEHFKHDKILVYDLGLTKSQVNHIKDSNKYIYAKYDFDKYPKHAKTLMNMVFKVTIWIECLKKYGACLWFDTSILFQENADKVIKSHVIGNDVDFLYYIHPAGHNIAWATHPEMFGYFPSNVSVFNEIDRKMSMAGAVIIYDTEECRNGIIKWAYMCALTSSCIEPKSELWPKRLWHGIMYHDNHYCNGTTPKQRPYNCHRYDQSLLSILVNNFYGYETERFHLEQKDWIAVTRRVG